MTPEVPKNKSINFTHNIMRMFLQYLIESPIEHSPVHGLLEATVAVKLVVVTRGELLVK